VNRRKQPYKYGVPAKYVSGLSEADAKKRAREILATASAYKKDQLVYVMNTEANNAEKKQSKAESIVALNADVE
jgi:hypothetical protein